MLRKIRQNRAIKEKYKRKLSTDEEVMRFVIKAVSSAALFFTVVIGMDAYRFLH